MSDHRTVPRGDSQQLLPQTDRASAFVVDPVEIFLASSLITMQNMVVVSHTVCAHIGGPKKFGEAGAVLMNIFISLKLVVYTIKQGLN